MYQPAKCRVARYSLPSQPAAPPGVQRDFYRGAEIRTRDLTDPNGARYQAAPRPDARSVFHTALVVRPSGHATPAGARYRRPVPAPSADILAELDHLLDPARFEDYGPNGLQVPGAPQVDTVATGVSANLELFERAAAEKAQLLIVHHGLFWGTSPGPIDAALKRRLKILFDADIGLAAYHLPLDAHPDARQQRADRAKRSAPSRSSPSPCTTASRSASSPRCPAAACPPKTSSRACAS